MAKGGAKAATRPKKVTKPGLMLDGKYFPMVEETYSLDEAIHVCALWGVECVQDIPDTKGLPLARVLGNPRHLKEMVFRIRYREAQKKGLTFTIDDMEAIGATSFDNLDLAMPDPPAAKVNGNGAGPPAVAGKAAKRQPSTRRSVPRSSSRGSSKSSSTG